MKIKMLHPKNFPKKNHERKNCPQQSDIFWGKCVIYSQKIRTNRNLKPWGILWYDSIVFR